MSSWRFRFHEEDGISPDLAARAVGLGADGTPTPGRVTLEPGSVLRLETREPGAAAISLPVDAGPAGVLRLQTTLLPPSGEPYPLLYELARHRIKLYLAKGEEWGMFEGDLAPDATARFEESRDLLGRATTEADPRRSSRLARESLIAGLDASERLASAHARLQIRRKYAGRKVSESSLGLELDLSVSTKLAESRHLEPFGLVSLPLRWAEIEPSQGRFAFDRLDRWMVALSRARRRILAGPLVDLSLDFLPDWVLARRGDATALRDAAFAFCEQVVNRYRGAVSLWNIASGLASAASDEAEVVRAIGLVRMASVLVRQLHPEGKILVEITDPFAERRWTKPDGIGPLRFLRRIGEEGIHFDSVGLRLVMGESIDGCRDLAELASLADRFVSPERHVVVSALGAPSEPRSGDPSGWHGEWEPLRQAAWLGEALPILLARPRFTTVVWGSLLDRAEAPVRAGLYDVAGRAKPAAARLEAIRKALREEPPRLPDGLFQAHRPSTARIEP